GSETGVYRAGRSHFAGREIGAAKSLQASGAAHGTALLQRYDGNWSDETGIRTGDRGSAAIVGGRIRRYAIGGLHDPSADHSPNVSNRIGQTCIWRSIRGGEESDSGATRNRIQSQNAPDSTQFHGLSSNSNRGKAAGCDDTHATEWVLHP